MRIRALAPTAAIALVLCAGAQASAGPRAGTYKAITGQCGTAAAAHPCYSFTIKIAKGRCVPFGGHRRKPGLCVTFSHNAIVALSYLDVTCPDGKTFASQILGPAIPYLLGPTGSLNFKAQAGTTEGEKEFVAEKEKLTLLAHGSTIKGTLNLLTQENIGLEPPTCSSGTVAFTAKRA